MSGCFPILRRAMLLPTLLILTSCETTPADTSATSPNDFCLQMEAPIALSKKDTDGTILQVEKLNARWDALCRPKSFGVMKWGQ